jgi:hypothetical protein
VLRAFRTSIVMVIVAAASVAIPTGAAGATCQSWGAPPQVGGIAVTIQDVSAAGPCAAWAVGSFDDGGTTHTLILRWNGTDWSIQPSPNEGLGANYLRGVTAISSTNAWAVGSYQGPVDSLTLILHWNGTAWKVIKSPNAVTDSFNDLFDVDATSKNDVWAVGERDDNGTGYRALTLHWNGTAWKLQKSPDVAGANDELFGVAGASGSDAWAVGDSDTGTLILHWNGSRWRRTPSPSPGTGAVLWGVDALATGRAWASGQFNSASGDTALVLRWNGSSWKRQAAPTPGDLSVLLSVAAGSKTNVWAVGWTAGSFGTSTLVIHWNGAAWKRQPSPNPDQSFPLDNILYGVTAVPHGGAWAVGDYDGPPRTPVIIHCC